MNDPKQMSDAELRQRLVNLPPNEDLTPDDEAVLAEAESRDLDF